MTEAIIETCSCQASITVPLGAPGVVEFLQDWRDSHRHDFAPLPNRDNEGAITESYSEPPFVDESVSSHERAADEFPPERALIGFQRNH